MKLKLIVIILFLVFMLSQKVPIEYFRDGTESFVQDNVVPNTREEAIKWLIN